MRSHTDGVMSELQIDGTPIARDFTPATGDDAALSHHLHASLPDGRTLHIEAGWISARDITIAVHVDGELIFQSHSGEPIVHGESVYGGAGPTLPKSGGIAVRERWQNGNSELANQDEGYDPTVWKRNQIPLGIDIGLGLLFFVIAKLTDLTTAAVAGAVIGIALLIIQRISKIDLLGGLAMFGIVMMLISAGLAIIFDSEDAVKYRTTFMGLLGATLFFTDGALGGKRLVKRLLLYLPYTDLDPVRLGLGMGLMGLVMAGVNQAVAMLASTDVWLFYTTFGDFVLTMGLILIVFRWARGQMAREAYPAYRTREQRWPDEVMG